MKRSRKRWLATVIAALAVLAAGCSSSSSSASSGPVTLHEWLWDPTQLSSYQACANAFHAKTGITVDISQSGWSDYWTNLTTQLAAGRGPDIITDHVGYYPQLVSAGQLVNLAPYFKKDGYNPASTGITTNGLWTRGSAIYGISQDRDAVALLYNTRDTSATAVTGLTWNPVSGGTFGALIRHLTVDKNGIRGDQPGFNKNDVKTYGFAMESGDGIAGQSSWATFALDMGWYWTTPQAPFATTYNMASPQLAQVFSWLQKQYDAGYIAPEARIASLGITPVMDQNVAATTFQGAWTISTYAPSADKNQTYAWAQLPVGPNGRSMTISNSLAQSVLTVSHYPAQATKWVEFVGSTACQNLVAAKAVVFPSIPSEAAKVLAVDQAKGINVTPFTTELANQSDLVFWPITSDGTQINTLATVAVDDTLTRGQGNPSTVLTNLNNSINALFK
jgi:multiple sugar transport system substrate-binding protein